MIKLKDKAWAFVFIFLWLMPIAFIGLTNKDVPYMPRTLSYIQRIAFLFTHSLDSWPLYYIEAKEEGSTSWVELTESDYFKLKPFGYRTRLHQFLYYSKDLTDYKDGINTALEREEELANWIAKRYSSLYPEKPKLNEVRFLTVAHPLKLEHKYEGAWKKPPLSSINKKNIYTLSKHNVK